MRHIPISLVFAYAIDGEKRGLEGFPQRAILNPEGQDITYLTRKYWGFVIHPEFVFTV
ncbi:hypothetical protein KBT16_13110 [Nostoc sp. CCCryo 231-06]|nr:hypothetical protein [Nostoc sp. CCCryo 231-06]